MSWINVFLVGCFWLFLPIMYVTMRNNTLCKKGLILSVTLPPEGQADPEVTAYTAAFRKHLFRSVVMLTISLLPALFLPWFSVCTSWCMVWMLVAMFVLFRVYGKGYEGLRDIKRRRSWLIARAGKTVAEVQDLKLPKPIKTGWFVPPMILSILPVISVLVDELDPAWSLLLQVNAYMCLGITAGSLVFHGLIFRQKPDVVDDNIDRTAALTRVRRYNWTKTWLLMAWLTGLYSVAVWIGQGNGYLAITVIYSALIVLVALVTEFAVRRAQHRLNGNTMPVVDEDDYWIWGQFYYNPNDKKAFVNERVGMGMSTNFATPAGKAMAVFTIVVLVGLLPLCGWLVAEEMTPITLGYTEDVVIARHSGTTYEIPMDDVIHTELLDTLPSSSKMWGTDMTHLLKGQFSAEGYGTVTFCLDPEDPPFLVLHTENEIYFFTGKQAEEIYQQIQSLH